MGIHHVNSEMAIERLLELKAKGDRLICSVCGSEVLVEHSVVRCIKSADHIYHHETRADDWDDFEQFVDKVKTEDAENKRSTEGDK